MYIHTNILTARACSGTAAYGLLCKPHGGGVTHGQTPANMLGLQATHKGSLAEGPKAAI